MSGYFPRAEFRAIFSERATRVLEQLSDFVDTVSRVGAVEEAAAALDTTVEALDGTITAAEAAIVALDGRIDAYDALAPFVRQDQGAAWSAATGTEARTALASYAGQVVSNPPTQAEMQALDDAVKAMSQALVAAINDLRGNGSFT